MLANLEIAYCSAIAKQNQLIVVAGCRDSRKRGVVEEL